MSLANLHRIGQLKQHPVDVQEIGRLLAAAERSLADARIDAVSAETRFDAAYRSITQSALAALLSRGYRPDTSRPGHHATILQTLPLTLGTDAKRVVVLDALRRKRNLSDYSGEDVDDASVAACIDAASRLLIDAKKALKPPA